MEKTKNIKLSRKTAVSLIRSVIPMPVSAIKKEMCSYGLITYTARTGALDITCSNDWFSGNGRIELTISDRLGGGSIIMYFRPDTLSRDHEAEDAEEAERRRIDRERWAGEVGREQAHKLVDQYLGCL